MIRATGELGDGVSSYATTCHLVGDRVACASCDHLDHAVRFVAEDLPVCEDCEAHAPEELGEAEAWLREGG
jgi:hypothetical protein